MKSKKIFSWDFHGTLEQGTEIGFAEILKVLAKEFEYNREIELVEVRKLYGTSMRNYLEHFFPKATKGTLNKMINRVPKIQHGDFIKTFISPAPYAVEVLTKIKEAGHLNIVVSNSSPKHIGKFVESIDIGHLLEGIFATDRHFAKEEIDPVKSKAKAISRYADKSGIEDIVVIGDRITDIKAGRISGAYCVQYIREGFPTDETDADLVIKDLREVLKLI